VLAFAVAALAIALSTIRGFPRRRGHELPAATAPEPTTPAAVGFDLDVATGTFSLRVVHRGTSSRLAVVGPSGSGKSLTLRTLAGLLGPGAGTVSYRGVDVSAIPPQRRNVGYVPQGFGLMPGRTVWQQVMLGVDADAGRAAWWLDALGLGTLIDRYPEQLSGGQQQRVSLARALAPGPDVVLLDEPFSALDAAVRLELRRELRALQHRSGLSTVLVTHDPEEAAYLADEVVVLTDGLVLQSGPVRDVYRRPCSLEVARLLGLQNAGEGVIGADGRSLLAGAAVFVIDEQFLPRTRVLWSVPPESVRICETPATTGAAAVPATRTSSHAATVLDVIDLGFAVELMVRLESGVELATRSRDPIVASVGAACLVQLASEALSVWPVSPDRPAATPAPSGSEGG
jgi:ABC-type sulfate/molybdate transport systems ATPase subunit